ncbi:MAG TPA: DNA mismatch repair protein MutS [Bacteroidia bacterium]|nr:DNA mismatch repair protein MutS [Bacteroidia bacterium]
MIKTAVKESGDTPLMKQYHTIKAKYPDALLLFRVGDFYETFGQDAIKASAILGIVLTRKSAGTSGSTELAGFPYHSLDSYLPKLVRAGHRVAICDQLEDPKMTKTIVKRGITELVTPGVSYNDKVLQHNANNFLAGVFWQGKQAGVAFLDVSTGEFLVAQGDNDYVEKLLQSFQPTEVLYPKDKKKEFTELWGEKFYNYPLDGWIYTEDYGRETLLKHFGTLSLKGFGIQDMKEAIIAAGAVLHYLADTQHDKVQHINKIARIERDHFMWLDEFTIRNLELVQPLHDRGRSLMEVLDKTSSPMGSRLLRRWVTFPLKEKALIEERLDMVEFFLGHEEFLEETEQQIKVIGDLERLISKVAVARISPREVVQLKNALRSIEVIQRDCAGTKNKYLKKISEQFNPCKSMSERIEAEIVPEPPALVNKGNVISQGINVELDELRKIAFSGKDYLVQIQQREVQRTTISSLKIGFNNVFGYYLEVTNTHKDKVPADWIRKQTLANCERYVTEELKQYEEKILGAEEKILHLEEKLFNELVLALSDYVAPVQLNAALIARLDCLVSFAKVSRKNNYIRPHIKDDKGIEIKNGRHPVIEQQLPPGEAYVSNDVCLDDHTQQIMVITGPNMSGKSALLRQVALIVIMAQMGCFVPAQNAELGIVDKVFTRVGASDNISSGESTFMVEMNETASILNNISDRSLILLDEIGRGTSTYDGISIAWAIAEYLHEHPTGKAKTLFATHYHELNEMENVFKRIKNFNVSVKETGNKVIFLRKLVPGGSAHSFGIHVAKMAGMPVKVVQRANEVLKQLENTHSPAMVNDKTKAVKKDEEFQLSFFQLNDPLLEQIREEIQNTDIDSLSPIDALLKLNKIKKHIEGK